MIHNRTQKVRFVVAFLSLTALVISLFAREKASAQFPEPFEIDAKTGISYGFGYDTNRKSFFKKCVDYSDAQPKVKSGQPLTKSKFELVTSTSEITEKMGLSVEASFSALTPAGKISASNKTELARGAKTSKYNLSLLAYSYAYKIPEFINIDSISLKPEYKQLLDQGKKNEFKATCGDTFVLGIRKGREFYGTVYVDEQSMENWSDFQNLTKVKWDASSYDVEVGVDFTTAMKRAFRSSSIKVDARSNVEGVENPSNLEQLVKIHRDFNKYPGGDGDIKFYLISYQALNDVQVEDPLDINRIEVLQGYLVTALWDLKALQEDAQFILEHRDMFAMGSKKEKQTERYNYVKQLQKRWKDEFWSLQTETKKCMEVFSSKCEQLANKYENRNLELLLERELLPARYSSNCYKEEWLKGDDLLKELFQTERLELGRHDMDDSEMDGNPVRVSSYLYLRPDGKELKGRYEVNLEEWHTNNKGQRKDCKNCRTRFRKITRDTVIHKLDQMGSDLTECLYDGIGIQGPIHREQKVLAPTPQNPFNLKTVPLPDVAGMTDAISNKHPPHDTVVVLNSGAKGMLKSSRCVLDTKGGEDNKLYCERPDTTNAKLALLNALDMEADKWTTPRTVTVNLKSKAAANLKVRNQKLLNLKQERSVKLKSFPAPMQKKIKTNITKSRQLMLKPVTPIKSIKK
ncbi:MAG: hypothetical protein JXA30_19910 [Deltaproteobacteria bacterium]|nr:hypothetical protein [Deltaproteobacteria bacterium]